VAGLVAVLAVDVAEPPVSVVQGDRQELREQPEAVGPLLVLQGQAPAPPGCEEDEEGEEVSAMADSKDSGKDVKLTGKDKDGKLDKILGRGSNPKNK